MSPASQAAREFVDRCSEGCRGDSVELETGKGEPMTLIANPGTPRSDVRLLMMRLEEHGYEIGLEHDGDETRAYTVRHPGYGGAGD